MTKHKKKIYFFFPLASIGGTESVHGDILEALKDYPSETYIRYRTNVWKGKEYAQSRAAYQEGVAMLKKFKSSSKVTFVSNWLDSARFGRPIRYLFMKKLIWKINKENTLVIFWHRDSIEFLWPHLKPHVKILDIVHNNSNNDCPDAIYLLNDWVPRIDRRVLVSEGLKKWLYPLYTKSSYPEEYKSRISTIQHMVEFPIEGFIEKSSEQLNVLFVGRDAVEKRFELFLEIANRFKGLGSKIKFHVVGPDPEKYKEIALANINWYFEISERTKLNEIYRMAHIILSTSSSEGFPKVFAEGMAFSCVPLTTAVGGIPDQLKHDENALFTEKDNCVNQSVDYLLKLENEQELYQQLSRNAYLYAQENFDSQRFTHEWNKLLSTLG